MSNKGSDPFGCLAIVFIGLVVFIVADIIWMAIERLLL